MRPRGTAKAEDGAGVLVALRRMLARNDRVSIKALRQATGLTDQSVSAAMLRLRGSGVIAYRRGSYRTMSVLPEVDVAAVRGEPAFAAPLRGEIVATRARLNALVVAADALGVEVPQ